MPTIEPCSSTSESTKRLRTCAEKQPSPGLTSSATNLPSVSLGIGNVTAAGFPFWQPPLSTTSKAGSSAGNLASKLSLSIHPLPVPVREDSDVSRNVVSHGIHLSNLSASLSVHQALLASQQALLEDHGSSSSGNLNTPHVTFTAPVWPGYSQELDTLNATFEGSLSGLVDLAANSPYSSNKYMSSDACDDDESSSTAASNGEQTALAQGNAAPSDVMEFVKRQSSNTATNEHYFQYVLMTPTSAAVRLYEESLTYMNQGQSYEIKCKKLGGSSSGGKCFKSIVRIGFHDRRQKFQEKELLQQWKHMHMGERILEFDLPMSYGIYNSRSGDVNGVEFFWDPSKQTSAFLKVNCMSTEFTAKKHGGEKGVPFRIQIDTFQMTENSEPKHVHSAYAQIKVFKTKGADRKNKTDREKAEKKGEKERYQPAYDYTILTELFPFDVYDGDDSGGSQCDSLASPSKTEVRTVAAMLPPLPHCSSTNDHESGLSCGIKDELSSQGASSPALSIDGKLSPPYHSECLPMDGDAHETAEWLRKQRYSNYLKVFANFTAADLLRLNRDDLIQICGVADGIRLYNSLQSKQICPKLTLYLCQPGAPAYNAVFLMNLTLNELILKICRIVLDVDPTCILDVYCEGPGDINVLVTDEVVQNMVDKCRYVIDLMKSQESERETYRMLLKLPKIM